MDQLMHEDAVHQVNAYNKTCQRNLQETRNLYQEGAQLYRNALTGHHTDHEYRHTLQQVLINPVTLVVIATLL